MAPRTRAPRSGAPGSTGGERAPSDRETPGDRAPRDRETPGERETAGERGTAAQRDRRRRILEATLALASKGGYDAVQMRTVAENAEVALGTLYRYFPSKNHLLVSGLAVEFDRIQEGIDRTRIPGDSPFERTLYVLGRVTRVMQREPQLTEAMTRAFLFADSSAVTEVNLVGLKMEHMFTRAMREGEPSADDKAVARIIGDVWLANLVTLVTHRASTADVINHLELTARLLLRD